MKLFFECLILNVKERFQEMEASLGKSVCTSSEFVPEESECSVLWVSAHAILCLTFLEILSSYC